MTNVVFILPSFNSGGAERVSITYLRQLDLIKNNVTLVVFKKTEDLHRLVPKNVKLVDLKTDSTSRSFLPLLKTLRELKANVVFTSHSRISTLLFLIKPFVPKFRHLARMQSTPSLEKKYGVYGGLRRKLYALGFRSADLVIAQTAVMKQDGVALFGLNPHRVKVLSNPIDTAMIDKSLEGASSPFPEGQTASVASGRLSYEKGFDVLISALALVLEKYPSLVLYILGTDKGEGEKLRKLVATLRLEENVIFLGFQPNPYRYYAYCDLFILSSRREGFPNVLLENYYLGTPIVSTLCVPVVNDFIQEGVNGFVCEPEDIEDLSNKLIKAVDLKRAHIKNPSYFGSELEQLL
jgi:glycosyltransferase involved in cell wall biosynthesis